MSTHAIRPRIIFVDHLARLSGGERVLLTLLPALADDVDVRVILGEDGVLASRLQELGIEVEVIPLPVRVRDVRRERFRLMSVDAAALPQLAGYTVRLAQRFRSLDADVVHTNSLKAALYGGTAARLARVPVVWHIRDRIAPDYLPRNAVRLVRTAIRILPSAVIANSETTLATLPESVRGRVVYNPVATPDSACAPHRTSGEFTVGVVGRLAPWKGQDVFLDAFANAFRGTSARGRIVGSAMFGEDAYGHSLVRQAERLGVGEQIEFRGFREDIWSELQQLDVLVHCSVTTEPFGQVVLEGMAAGVPVIAAAAGGPAETITPGVDGLLTRPGDAYALADALLRVRGDTALRESLARAGRLRSAEYTPERAADQLVAVYRELASKAFRG